MSVYEIRGPSAAVPARRRARAQPRAARVGAERALGADPPRRGPRVHLPRPAAGDLAGGPAAAQPARAGRRLRQERARRRDAGRARVRPPGDRVGVGRRLRRQPEAAPVPDPAGRGDRRRLRRAQRRRVRGPRAADRPAARPRRREPGQDQRSRSARRRTRGLRGLRGVPRRPPGPRGLRRAEHELPELGRRPRLLRRAVARRRAARPARASATSASR